LTETDSRHPALVAEAAPIAFVVTDADGILRLLSLHAWSHE
jgi:hypothetical protein